MSPKKHLDIIFKEIHDLNEHGHLWCDDALIRCGAVEEALKELQDVLEKGKNYESSEP